MNDADTKQLSAELCKRWKGKLTRDDLAYWARELGDYAIVDVTEALTKFKNSSRFLPKVSEIRGLLPQRVDGSQAPKTLADKEGSFADVLRRQNRQYAGRSDAEVYLRYHRSLWVAYGGEKSRNPDSVKRQLNSGCINNLMNIPKTLEQAEQLATFIYDSPEMFRNLLNELRETEPKPGEQQQAPAEHQFT
jgi:hypothetical protein